MDLSKNKFIRLLLVFGFIGAAVAGTVNYMYRLQMVSYPEMEKAYIKATIYQDNLITMELAFSLKDKDSTVTPVKVWAEPIDGKVMVTVFKQLTKPFPAPQFYAPPRKETKPTFDPNKQEYVAKILVGNPHGNKYYYRDKSGLHELHIDIKRETDTNFKDILRQKMQEKIKQAE